MTLKWDPTEIIEQNNIENIFNLIFLQNRYSELQRVGQHSLLSSGYLTFIYAGLSTYLLSSICFPRCAKYVELTYSSHYMVVVVVENVVHVVVVAEGGLLLRLHLS